MNTFLAGQFNQSNEGRAYEAENGSIVDVSRDSPRLTGVLDEGQYFITLESTNGAELETGVLNIRSSSYENLSQQRHPDASLNELDEVDEVSDNSNLSTTSKIAMADRDRSDQRDLLVHRVNISGIYGALDAIAESDLENADGNQVLADAQSEEALGVADDPVLDVELNQTNFKQNREPKVEQYQNPQDTDEFRFVIDEDNETLYVVTDVRDLELEREVGNQSDPRETQVNVNDEADGEGDNFTFDFDIGPGFEEEYEGGIDTYVPEGGTDVFLNVEDREAEFDEQDEDTVRVNPESNQTISGETNVAPGTEVVVAVDSRGPVRRANQTETSDLSPVFQRTTVSVGEDGNFSSNTFDFSDNEVGRNFTVTAPNQGFENEAAKPGIVVEGEPANASLSDITVSSDEDELATVTVDSAYLPQGGFVTIHDGTLADGAVFDSVRGTSEYLEEDTLHEDIEIELDDPYTEDGTAIAMPHRDTNDNETYDFVTSEGEEDAPYTAGDEDNIVTATASVTFETETPTPEPETATETPTETSTEAETPTPTETEDQPGFGAVLALIALIGAALLAARRNDF
jgi:PGF-CTERM protein